MHKIRYQVKILSPVLFSTQSGDMNMTATLDYIPGSAILGVLAGRYIQIKNLKEAHKDDEFYNWFLSLGIIFSNAYPCKDSKKYLPVPFSIQIKKNDEWKNGRKTTDLLRNHLDPKEQMETINGYCNIVDDTIQKFSPSKSLNFHHARPDRIKGHSTEGLIFNYESIDPGQLFEGEIIGDETVLKKFVELIGNEFPIKLGRSRTAQYGQAELKILSEQPEKIEIEDKLENEIYLTFLSPTILYNENGFPSTSLKSLARYLSEALGIRQDQIMIEKSFKKPVEIENFIAVWKLKKPSEVAFEAGSCFLIQIDGWNDSIKSKLIELQKDGIGERRGEGFGRIALNRWHKENSYTVKKSDKTEIEKPGGSIPKRTAEIFKEVIKENWRKVIERKALDEYKEFSKHNPPTNSLLGRLEMMLENAGDIEQFLGQLLKLRKTARDKLEGCRGKDITLLELIEKGNPDLGHTFKQVMKLEEMAKEIKYDPSTDTEFCNNLYKLYWLTFFRMMRKSNKNGGNR